MKKCLILSIAILLVICGYSQNKYFFVFCANETKWGHAFVSVGHEDSSQQMSIHDGTYGLYPKTKLDGSKSYLIGEVPGELRNDFFERPDHKIIVVVTDKEYQMGLDTIKHWLNKEYEIKKSDCLDFLITMAKILEGKIKLPEREWLLNYPANFLQEMITINKHIPDISNSNDQHEFAIFIDTVNIGEWYKIEILKTSKIFENSSNYSWAVKTDMDFHIDTKNSDNGCFEYRIKKKGSVDTLTVCLIVDHITGEKRVYDIIINVKKKDKFNPRHFRIRCS